MYRVTVVTVTGSTLPFNIDHKLCLMGRCTLAKKIVESTRSFHIHMVASEIPCWMGEFSMQRILLVELTIFQGYRSYSTQRGKKLSRWGLSWLFQFFYQSVAISCWFCLLPVNPVKPLPWWVESLSSDFYSLIILFYNFWLILSIYQSYQMNTN